MELTRDILGHYRLHGPQSEADILTLAEDILRRRLERQGAITCPADATHYLRMRLAHLPHEEFHAVWLDTRHKIVGTERLFTGTIDGCSVYPREVARSALRWNAAAVIFAHNHPSGNPEPSAADRAITLKLRDALGIFDIRVLDHVVVATEGTSSLAQCGLL